MIAGMFLGREASMIRILVLAACALLVTSCARISVYSYMARNTRFSMRTTCWGPKCSAVCRTEHGRTLTTKVTIDSRGKARLSEQLIILKSFTPSVGFGQNLLPAREYDCPALRFLPVKASVSGTRSPKPFCRTAAAAAATDKARPSLAPNIPTVFRRQRGQQSWEYPAGWRGESSRLFWASSRPLWPQAACRPAISRTA